MEAHTKELTSQETEQIQYDCPICEDQEFIYDKETNTAKVCSCNERKKYQITL